MHALHIVNRRYCIFDPWSSEALRRHHIVSALQADNRMTGEHVLLFQLPSRLVIVFGHISVSRDPASFCMSS